MAQIKFNRQRFLIGLAVMTTIASVFFSSEIKASESIDEDDRQEAVDIYREVLMAYRAEYERYQVEVALGKNLERHHAWYMRNPEYQELSYSKYWLQRYERRLRVGKYLAVIVAPIIAVTFTSAAIAYHIHIKNLPECTDGECWDELTPFFGRLGLWMIAGVGTFATLLSGFILYAKSKSKVDKLREISLQKARVTCRPGLTSFGCSF